MACSSITHPGAPAAGRWDLRRLSLVARKQLLLVSAVVAWAGIVVVRILPAFLSFESHHGLARSNRRVLNRLLLNFEGAKSATAVCTPGSADTGFSTTKRSGLITDWTVTDTNNLANAIVYRRELISCHCALKWQAFWCNAC
jgi:NhaP-type Na+/H+ or K+/H+ antiporter